MKWSVMILVTENLQAAMRRQRRTKCLLFFIILLAFLMLLYSRPLDQPRITRRCGLAKAKARYIIHFRGSCFYIPKESMNWFTGLRHCLLHDLSLAALNDKAKLQLLSRHFRRQSMRQEYWFGGTELGSIAPDDFWYVSNGQRVEYFGEKRLVREKSGQQCLKLNIHHNTTHVATDYCLAVHPVICERRWLDELRSDAQDEVESE